MKISYFIFVFTFFSLFSSESIKYNKLEVFRSSSFTYNETNQSIHIIEVDPKKHIIKPVKALDDGLGRESVLSINDRYGAIAAINGGFFDINGTFDGRACGTLKINDWSAIPRRFIKTNKIEFFSFSKKIGIEIS